jgi:predicted PurR-regulated permease PerM
LCVENLNTTEMKKIATLISLLMLLIAAPSMAKASNENSTPNNTMNEAELKSLVNRLEEIKSMDKSDLNSLEKKELRKEIRSINKDLKTNAGGVYLSVGAILVVILLLILLL